MKKLLFTILASVLLLSSCGKMKTTDDLIKKARKEMEQHTERSMNNILKSFKFR